MIYVCIPAHNEARTLGPLIWKVREALRDFDRQFEVVIFDDASSDDTADVLTRYESSVPLRVLESKTRLGYGRSVERLLRDVAKRSQYPKRDGAVVLQGDLTEDPADVIALVKAMEGGADIVAGAVEEGLDEAPRSLRVARWCAGRVLGRTRKGAPVSDVLSGLRLYRVIVLKKAFRDEDDWVLTHESPWSANVGLLRTFHPHARRVAEVPICFRHGLLARESRFRAMEYLKALVGERGHRWAESDSGRAA